MTGPEGTAGHTCLYHSLWYRPMRHCQPFPRGTSRAPNPGPLGASTILPAALATVCVGWPWPLGGCQLD
jgi:hypothetical protein